MIDADLKYYLFDWDDNILFMPTKIHLEYEGEPVDVTTAEFARIRQNPAYKPLNNDPAQAFSGFRDEHGDFVGDTIKAIESKSFAPSYWAFKRCLKQGRLFGIVTARGHSEATTRKGVEKFIEIALTDAERKEMLDSVQAWNRQAGIDVTDEEAMTRYLDLNGYTGVSSPAFQKRFRNTGGAASPSEAKTFVVEQFVDRVLELTKNLNMEPKSISFGFSDDDLGNLHKMQTFMEDQLVPKHPNLRFFTYNTSSPDVEVERL